MAENNKTTPTGINLEKALKSVDSQYKADAFSTSVDFHKQKENNDHEERMLQMQLDQEKKAAGWLSWMGWNMSSTSAIVSTCTVVLICVVLTTLILAFFKECNYMETFWKYAFHLLDILIGFIVGNKVSVSSNQKQEK